MRLLPLFTALIGSSQTASCTSALHMLRTSTGSRRGCINPGLHQSSTYTCCDGCLKSLASLPWRPPLQPPSLFAVQSAAVGSCLLKGLAAGQRVNACVQTPPPLITPATHAQHTHLHMQVCVAQPIVRDLQATTHQHKPKPKPE